MKNVILCGSKLFFRNCKSRIEMNKLIAYGLKLAVINFVLVALVGSVMRYKVAFSLPFIEHKNLLDAHSHFAFYGWITTAIYILILADIKSKFPDLKVTKYSVVCIINLIGAYGMLAAFTYNDYYWLSILFSTVSLLCGWTFWLMLYFDVRKNKTISTRWYVGGLFFAFISSAGVFYIGYLTGSKQITNESLHASIFYYLHFQYNGFYIFSVIGLLLSRLQKIGIQISFKENDLIYYSLFISCLLGYGLSLLWMDIPIWFYVGIVLGTLIQSYGWFVLLNFLAQWWKQIRQNWTGLQVFILIFVGFAFIVKTLLQQISIFPSVAQFAFDYRPVAIAYLHLILLMGISTFMMEQIISSTYFTFSKLGLTALKFYVLVIFVNQLFLGLDGFGSILHFGIPNMKYILLTLGILIAIALLFILMQLRIKKESFK